MIRPAISLIIPALMTCLCLQAQTERKWDVSNPGGPSKNVSFNVSEGTWMNLDVSPDGKEIVFDLLGDIYSIPVAGGQAKVLRGGHAMEVQPRFSPDGSQILFTSDAGGGDNIWIMKKDGSDARQVTRESFRLLNNATWTPDGNYFVARKHFTSGRSLGAGEMWLYHTSGGGGLQLTTRKNDQQDVNEPSVSPDGRYVFFSEDMYPGGFFQYNKDPNNQIFVIRRLDREKGELVDVTGGPGGAFRPQVSHDGKTLAFVKRVRTKTVLYLRNLDTGVEWPVYDSLSKDQQESWTIFGVYTGFAWMPGDASVVIWSNGQIHRVDITGVNKSVVIPFTCQVNQQISEAVRFKQQLDPDSFNVKLIRQAITSPDEKTLVFNAIGYLWKKSLPSGKPVRLTPAADAAYAMAGFETEPSFSPDGKSVIYATWNDSASGAIWRVNITGTAKPMKVTSKPGIYRQPSISPDGKWILFRREGGSDALGEPYTAQPGIYVMPVASGAPVLVRPDGDLPHFNLSSDRIYYQEGGGMNRSYNSCRFDGSDERVHLKSTYGSQFTVSPDENWVAFIDLHKAYIASFPKTGKAIDMGAGTTDYPVKVVTRDAGFNLHWSRDNTILHYTLGDQYFSINLADRFSFIAGKADSLFKVPEQGLAIGLNAKMDKPSGSIAFTHARIITMKGDEVINDGTIIVMNNKITAIGTDVTVPAGALVIDASGKTIMPGFIDAHAHGGHFRSGIIPQKHWPYFANLAYGVTTMHDPSANSELVFAQSELQKTGGMTGPRVFSTGTILYGADGDFKAVINNIDDARSALRRTKAMGAFSVKSYNQPRREQRQMIIQAARELQMEVVPEGGSMFYHNMSMILDGHTTIEHNIPVVSINDDVVQLWKNSNTAYTPTLIVSYGAVSGEFYWYQHSNVWEKERLLRFTPRSVIDTRSRHRIMLPEEEYENGHIAVARSVKKLADAGVTVNMGAHGQLQGLGAHWEIWMMAQGGMTPMQALHTATINSAKSLGLDDYIGSLETGKLADLLVMDRNPLDDIHNTESIRYTMVNGRLYDAETMNEIGNHPKTRTKFYWELNKNADSFPWHDGTLDVGCTCGKH